MLPRLIFAARTYTQDLLNHLYLTWCYIIQSIHIGWSPALLLSFYIFNYAQIWRFLNDYIIQEQISVAIRRRDGGESV